MQFHKTLSRFALAMTALFWAASQTCAEPSAPDLAAIHAKQSRRATQAQRQEAADRIKAARAAAGQAAKIAGRAALAAEPLVGQGDVPDYFSPTVPNWNYTPPLRKFVDGLPGLGPDSANLLGQYLPVAVADTTAYPGLNPGDVSHYYEIAVVQYEEQMHSDLPPTTMRGYVQIDTPAIPDTPSKYALTYPNGSPIRDAAGNQVYAVDKPHYLGPVIIAQRDVPVRIKLYNYLPTGYAGDFFIPVDPSVMGAGMGPRMIMPMQVTAVGTLATFRTMSAHGLQVGDKVSLHGFDPKAYNGFFTIQSVPSAMSFTIRLKTAPGGNATTLGHAMEMYTDNRAVLHLHGGRTPWISDGTPHQWITPAGESTSYPQGVSVQPVPDMDDNGDPRDGTMTYYYTNQQSARLMFYHDHVYGITRLNVYAGEAAGYLIQDQVESALAASNFIPQEQKVLVVQDKTFVDASTIGALDPTWRWGTGADADGNGYPDYKTGDLWVPHVYMPAQNPEDISGMAAMGRWHYGPWFWPPTVGIGHPPIPNPYYDPINYPWEPSLIPDVPDPSMGMEAFNDTPLVNGTAYPTMTVDPKAYRFRILSAANDRFFNLQLYEADPTIDIPGVGLTEVKMVRASEPCPPDPTWPQDFAEGNPTWPVDGREGGVPDWNTRGPDWIQIGTEGGFLPMPVVVPQRPIDWNTDVTTFDAGIVNSHSLLLGPAERADVIVDFSAYAGKTLILYNDAPAAFPAPDPRYDYYTGMPDMTDTGGHYPTNPGYGPNTRTIMQIKVNPNPVPETWLGLDAMMAKWRTTSTQEGVFKQDQDPIIVAQGELTEGYTQYNEAYNTTFANRAPDWGISRIQDSSLRFKTIDGTSVTIPMQPKAIQDEMGETFDDYGRMSGKLGLQLPSPQPAGQTFVLQSYVDPATEVITASMTPLTPPLASDGTQIWKITHNGVDVHPIHFHLYDVQLINRVAWDNNVRLPDANELGWKDTVRVNPLQDTIVALRPVLPALPFKLPDSVRLLDPTMPAGATWQSFDPFTAEAVTITNAYTNFGWEYMWHCHILSHEEMEMMRPIIFQVAPAAPSGLSATASATFPASVNLSWANNATNPPATKLVVERATDLGFTTGVTAIDVIDPAATTFTDTDVAEDVMYVYRIRAENDYGYSPWSNNASATTPLQPSPNTNVVTEWNRISVNAIRTAGFTSLTASRILAMVHAAVFDSVNSIAGTNRQYRMTVPGMSGASKEAAVASTAHRVLSNVFPSQAAALDAALSVSLAAVPDGPAKTDGIALGQAVADAMLAWRSSDNSNAMQMYMGGMNPGQWRPTPPAYAMGMMPLWGTVTPFAMDNGSQFRLAPPPALSSVEYAEALNETKNLGMKNSPSRSAEQTQIAYFWADSPGTITTVGRWNAIARSEGMARGMTLEEHARLFAVLNVSLADAGISAWDSKYFYALWRPVTAIREAAMDGNPLTDAVPNWLPELTTPAFPEYASAHSTFSGAGAEALARFFQSDSADISVASFADPEASRQFGTFTEVADEAGISRIYGGIHYRFSDTAGKNAGRSVAGHVFDNFFVSLFSAPVAPSNLTATAVGPTQVDLTWIDNADNETSFRIERAIGAGAFASIGTTGADTVAFSDTAAPDGKTVTYRVVAINAYGSSRPSNVATVTLPLAAPSGLTASMPIQAILAVNLVWTDNSVSETGFTIQRATTASFATPTTYTVGANVTTFNNTGVSRNVTYYYRVRANNGTPSDWSNAVSIRTSAPTPPSSLTAIASPLSANPPTVTLNWQDNSTNETGFLLVRATNNGFTQGVTTFNLGADITTHIDTTVQTNRRYYYRVRAINGAGGSNWSNSVNVLTPGQLPLAPTNLVLVGSTTNSITIGWTDNAANEAGFYIERSSNGTTGWTRLGFVGANVTQYTNTGLGTNRTYYYRVQAYNGNGATDYTNVVSGSTGLALRRPR